MMKERGWAARAASASKHAGVQAVLVEAGETAQWRMQLGWILWSLPDAPYAPQPCAWGRGGRAVSAVLDTLSMAGGADNYCFILPCTDASPPFND